MAFMLKFRFLNLPTIKDKFLTMKLAKPKFDQKVPNLSTGLAMAVFGIKI